MELYNVVTYCTDLELIKKYLDEMKFKYKGILHDRDDKKKPHVHLIIACENEVSYRSLAEMLQNGFKQNVFVQGVKDYCEAEDYLCHEHSRTKAKYSQDEKFTNDSEYFKDLYTINYHRDDNLVEDLITGEWNVISLARKYGLDFVKNFKTYEYFHTIVMQQAEQERIENDLYLKKVAESSRLRADRYDEVTKICEDFEVTRDSVGDWTYKDYVRAHEWVRKYRRYKQQNIVYLFVLRKLDDDTRLALERLIYKRMSDSIPQIFVEVDPYHRSYAELLEDAKLPGAGLPLPTYRRNIYVKSTEYDD